ncbi:MAG: addiction module protein [Nitrosomonas sp.]|nr:addiction module protein [Nitrosomonas sp.]MBP6076892.1 addiction module protein [Nitrosomonas sp.]
MFHPEGEIAENWLAEVQHRARELDEGMVQPIPANEVRRKARALLR